MNYVIQFQILNQNKLDIIHIDATVSGLTQNSYRNQIEIEKICSILGIREQDFNFNSGTTLDSLENRMDMKPSFNKLSSRGEGAECYCIAMIRSRI